MVTPTDTESLMELWGTKFRAGARRMLRTLVDNYPNKVSREDLGLYSEISHTSGTFGVYLSELKRNGLIQIFNGGKNMKATAEIIGE